MLDTSVFKALCAIFGSINYQQFSGFILESYGHVSIVCCDRSHAPSQCCQLLRRTEFGGQSSVYISVPSLLRLWLTDLYRQPDEADVLYGDFDPREVDRAKRWWTVINCVKDAIWKCRNLLVFRGVYKSPASVAKVGLAQVRDYIFRDKMNRENGDLVKTWKMTDGLIKDNLLKVL